MTQEKRSEINKQNAQLSTGPKTEEGKAKSSQNATTHGLSSSKPPLENPIFLQHLRSFQARFPSPSPDHEPLVVELAHLAWKIKQIPSLEFQIEQNSPLTLAEHFSQDKPTPLTRFWNLELRIWGRYNSLLKKLTQLKTGSAVDVSSTDSRHHSTPSAPQSPELQNKPKSDVDVHVDTSSEGTPKEDKTPDLQIEPTSIQSLANDMQEILRQNPGMAQRLLQNPDTDDDARDFIQSFLQNKPTATQVIPIPAQNTQK